MSYIVKNTTGIINTRLTDAGRRKLSQGNFNISYFQVGDSEVCYNCTSSLDESTLNILIPQYNAQNNSGLPQSNKGNIKYPFYLDQTSGTTWGIPFENASIDDFFNQTVSRGPFTGSSFQTSSAYTTNSNYSFSFSDLTGTTNLEITYNILCDADEFPEVGQILALFYDPNSGSGCGSITGSYMTEFYTITGIGSTSFFVDRPIPTFDVSGITGDAKIFIYPSGFTPYYDSSTSEGYWPDEAFSFDLNCTIRDEKPLVWNLSIPWSEDPAGLWSSTFVGYNNFASKTYLGTKEYLGYQTDSAQSDTDSTYYFNSFSEKVIVTPNNQKAIGIVHYTNNEINNNYGEKFATEPFDPSDSGATGQARNLRIKMPLLMWHKNPNQTIGETFYIDPPGFDGLDLLTPYYIRSNINNNMNDPGMRYYHLWDTNANTNGIPNRVGKVFPDDKLVIIDDEEIIAAMSYKSNRNWTLPSPKISLITPNTCGNDNSTVTGILTGLTESLYVTYRLSNTDLFTDSLHFNYYSFIQGPNDCGPITPQNVAVRFGGEFGCLNQPFYPTTTTTTSHYPTTTTTTSYYPTTTTTTTYYPVTTTTTSICPTYCDVTQGFLANKFEILCQKVVGNARPNSSEWVAIDFTSQLTSTMVNGYITQEGLTGNTFVITQQDYDNAPTYNLNDYIPLTPVGYTGTSLNFGDEYYFYGSLETDIQATIYEMKYKINLGQAEFQTTSNPTWTSSKPSFVSEIGLYDSNKNLMIISKMQSPVLRQGIQQFLIKFDI